MRWTIGKRIFVALTATSLIVVVLSALANRWSFQRGFVDYLAQQEVAQLQDFSAELEAHYAVLGSWDTLRGNRRLWDDLFHRAVGGDAGPFGGARPPPPRNGDRRGPPGRGAPPPPHLIELLPRVALHDDSGGRVIGPGAPQDRGHRININVAGKTVGTLFVAEGPELTDALDVGFAQEQTRSSIMIGVVTLLIAGLLAALIARQMKRPIVALVNGTRALTNGRFDERITVTREDELGDLATDFNNLANTLQKNQQSRRLWVSDISHELRTPLAILDGELQALEDGVRQFDEGTRASLQAEVQRLSKLVGDLHELTVSDEGGRDFRKHPLDICKLVVDCVESQKSRLADAGIDLQINAPSVEILVLGDERKLAQLVTNLIENSLRYTNRPGVFRVDISSDNDRVKLDFSDSAPGVANEQLDRLFERLYRVDESRNRATGGSGLGLAICKNIAVAHGGTIDAARSELGGIAIEVDLPRASTGALAQ